MSALFESAVARIKEALAKHPEVRLIEGVGSIRVAVDDPEGFDVEMIDDEDEVMVFAGPYHEHLEKAEEAAAAFLWMLTPTYRIVEMRRGNHTQTARLQREDDGKWETLGTVVFAVPSFGWKRSRILQNHVLSGPDAAD